MQDYLFHHRLQSWHSPLTQKKPNNNGWGTFLQLPVNVVGKTNKWETERLPHETLPANRTHLLRTRQHLRVFEPIVKISAKTYTHLLVHADGRPPPKMPNNMAPDILWKRVRSVYGTITRCYRLVWSVVHSQNTTLLSEVKNKEMGM